MVYRLLFVLVASFGSSSPFGAEIHRASTSLSEYVELIAPGSMSAQVHTLVIAVFSEAGDLVQLLSGNVEEAPAADEIGGLLDAAQGGSLAQTGVSGDRYTAVVHEAFALAGAARRTDRRTVLLLRLAPARTGGPEVQTVLDEAWEAAVLRWHQQAADHDLMILTLSAG